MDFLNVLDKWKIPPHLLIEPFEIVLFESRNPVIIVNLAVTAEVSASSMSLIPGAVSRRRQSTQRDDRLA